eukprot:GAHX01002492.1.p1 GENE.GAHX01002492.1~~GAHX01002492.1.p1  ORF type:complete len:516 (-),score=76.30 GAHX01002492.1:356-1903(-)
MLSLFFYVSLFFSTVRSVYNPTKDISIRTIVVSLNDKRLITYILHEYAQYLTHDTLESDLLVFSVHGIKNTFASNRNQSEDFRDHDTIAKYDLIYDNKIGGNEFLIFRKFSIGREITIDNSLTNDYFDYQFYQHFSNYRRGAQSVTLTINSKFKLRLVSANLTNGLTKFYDRTLLQRNINKHLLWNNKAHLTLYFGDLNYTLDYVVPALKKAKRRKVLWYYSNISKHINEKNYNFFYHLYFGLLDFEDNDKSAKDTEYSKELINNYDQLKFSKDYNFGFKGYKEPPIKFEPNYNLYRTKGVSRERKEFHIPYYKSRILYSTSSNNLDSFINVKKYKLLDKLNDTYSAKPVAMKAVISIPVLYNNADNENKYYKLQFLMQLSKEEIKKRNFNKDFKNVIAKVRKSDAIFNYGIDKRNYLQKENNISKLFTIRNNNEEENITNKTEFLTWEISLGFAKLNFLDMIRLDVIIIVDDSVQIRAEVMFTFTNGNVPIQSYLRDENGNVVGKGALLTEYKN